MTKAKDKKRSSAVAVDDDTQRMNSLRALASTADSVVLGDVKHEETKYIDTGNLAINFIISGKWYGGGIPHGRITEMYGNASTAKTGILTHMFAACQHQRGLPILIDSENAYSPSFAKKLGLGDEMVISRPHTLEECYDRMIEYTNKIAENPYWKDVPTLMGWDSIAAAPSAKEYEESTGEEQKDNTAEMGNRGRINSQKLRILQSHLMDHNIALVIINQLRSKVGVIYGSPETTAGGGRALEYYASVRIKLKRTKIITVAGSTRPRGIYLSVKIEKNKCNDPYWEADDIAFYFDYGLDPLSGIISAGRFADVIESPSSGWYCFKERPQSKFQKNGLLEFLRKDDNYTLLGFPSLEELERYIGLGQDALEATNSGEFQAQDAPEEDGGGLPTPSGRGGNKMVIAGSGGVV